MKRIRLPRSAVSLFHRIMVFGVFVPILVLPPRAIALPSGGQIVAGDVGITTGAGTLELTQGSHTAIVNWDDFSIGAGEIVNILQNSPDAALLNRVMGANPSELIGQLNANGRVFLINPNGVVVGRDASINAMEFVASALDVADEDFLNGGDLTFSGESTAGVLNLGTITASNGDVILVAHKVTNAGTIEAAQGVAALAAGQEVMLSPEGDQRVLVKTHLPADVGGADIGVDNSGVIAAAQAELKAAGGNIYELAINQTGVIRATGVAKIDGRVMLTAEAGAINVQGSLAAQDADGSGGEILVGGDYRGNNPTVANAAFATVGSEAVLDVSATAAKGDGGRVIVWSDQQTDFSGRIDGRAGEQGGNGAFAEVSSKSVLNYTGFADLRAAFGETGTLLLDPAEVVISAAADDPANGVFNSNVLATNLGGANVVVDASDSGNITVNDDVVWTGGTSLTLNAGDSITVNADIAGDAGSEVFFGLGSKIFEDSASRAKLTVAGGSTVSASKVTIGRNPNSPEGGALGLGQGRLGEGAYGSIDFAGILRADTLEILLKQEGIFGGVSFANPANEIGRFSVPGVSFGGVIDGDMTLVDSSGDLEVAAQLQVGSDNALQLSSAGDLILEAGTELTAFNTDVVLASTGGSFINQSDSNAIRNIDSGRALVYSGNPTDTILGSLALTPVYNKTFAGNAPATITQTGDRILYRLAPTITFSADDYTRTYGADNPALSFTMLGLVGGDTAAEAFSGAPLLSVGASSASDAGSYTITTAPGTVLASDYDYQIAFEPGTLTVDPAPLTIRADDQSRFVGVPNPTFTASFDGLVNGDSAADISGLTFTTNADLNSPSGSYAITPFGAVNPNYTISFMNGLLTVGDSTITIRANDFARFFGEMNPIFTGSVTAPTGFDFDLLTNLAYTATATAQSNVGTYAISPTVDALSGINFNLIPGTLTINARPLTVTAADASRLYGSANPTFSGSISGLAPFHTVDDIVGLSYTSAATQASNVGSYAITPTTGANPNYAINPVDGTLTVQQAPLTITADDASKIYADFDPTFTATDSGLVLDQSIADLGTLQITSGTTQLSSAGSYPITTSFSSTTGLANNYAIRFDPGTFTINPRPISFRAVDTARVFGELNPLFTYTSTGVNPPGITNASLGAFDGVRVETAATAASDAGSYALTVSGGTNSNFAYTYEPGLLTITPAPLTITADSVARLYGAENPNFTSTAGGLKFTDTLADVLSGFTLSTAATAASDAGSYPITPSGTQTNFNYAVDFVPGTLTVNKAPLFIAPALSSRLYGDPNPDFTISASGLVNGDTASVVQNLAFQTASPFSGVGSFPVNIVGASARNYELSYGAGTMNVLPRPLTITADSFSREYGEANPTFTASFDNLASFDSAAAITGLSLSTPATQASNVLAGGYAINVTSDTNPNYAIGYVPGKLDITPAPLLLEVGNVTRVYGDANPAPTTGIATGFKLDDTIDSLSLQVVTPATPTSDVGSYLYSASTANENYAVNIVGGQLTVTPAPLTVSVDDLSRTYGDANPAPTFVLGGLKFEFDRAGAVEVTNPTDTFSDVGTYAFSANVLDPNYTLAGVQGDLFITPRLLNLTAAASRVFGDANPAASSFSLSGDFVNGDQASDIVSFRYSTGIDATTDVGTYDISESSQVSLLSSNYTFDSLASSLAITPRPVNVNIAPVERLYGEANPSFTLEGESNIPDFNTVDQVLRFIAPDERTVPGNYTVEAEIINPNYMVGTLGFGGLTILPRELMVTVANVARYYGDINPAFSASFGGDGLPDFVDPGSILDLQTIAPTGPTANAGHYLISMLASSFDSERYRLVSFTPGVLSIFPRPVTLNIGNTEYAVARDAVLEEVVDFSDANFSVTGTNFANGQSAAAQFPDLEYVVTDRPAGTVVGVAADLENYTAPSVADFTNGTAPLSGSEVDPLTVAQYLPPVVAAAGGGAPETVEVDVVAVAIDDGLISTGVDTSSENFIPITTIGSDETRVTRSIGLSGGYLGTNPNYVVTAVNNGVLTLRNRTLIEEQIKIASDYAGQDQVIAVRGFSDYRANIGLLFSDFSDLSEDIVTRYLEGLYASGGMTDDALYLAIFGEGASVTPPFDAEAIRDWLLDISTNAEKRGAMALALVDYLKGLQDKDPSDYTDGERFLVTTVTGKVQEDREAFANTLRAREQSFEDYPNASRIYYGAREQMSVIEKRAAVAATGFLDFERGNMTEDEIRVAEAIQASVLDGDNSSTIALLEEWVAVRGDRHGSALIDGQFAGMLTEMGEFKAQADGAQASIASGEDQGAGLSFGTQNTFDFVNMEPPYGEFLKETAIAGLEAKMARYDLADGIGGASAAAAGVAAGAAASAGVSSAGTALSASLIPYVIVSGKVLPTSLAASSSISGAAAAAGGTVSTAATGAAIFVTAAVAVAIAGTITLVQQEEKKAIYEGIMEQGFGSVSLTDLKLSAPPADPGADPSPEDVPDQIMQTLLVQSLESMLLGI